MAEGAEFRSGFAGIVGRPNVGKSTMMNFFVGSKVAIVSPRPQTTRQRIAGILTRDDVQVTFLDSPGFHRPQHTLGRYMQEAVKTVMEEADVLVAVIDGNQGLREADERVFDNIKRSGHPALLAINKVDLMKKPKLLPLIDACAKTGVFEACIPVSAVTGDQMDVVLGMIIAHLPAGPRWYAQHQRSDQSLTHQVGELIREQVLHATREEVPHAVGVLVTEMEEREKVTAIHATILVERSGQKAIVIGRGGATMKAIGQKARAQIEPLVGRQVYLDLWVKVKPDWRSDERILRELGYVT